MTNPETEKPEEIPVAAEQAGTAAFDAAGAQAEIADLKDRLLRSMAEIENTRRRYEREREEAAKYAISRFARDILSVADNLRRALDSGPRGDDVPEPMRNLIAGIEVTERELLTVFERNDIKRIDALGEKFDANLHQAMFEIESADQPKGVVIQVVAPGYTIAGRLLRPAMVGVSKGPGTVAMAVQAAQAAQAAAKFSANEAATDNAAHNLDTKA